MICISVYDELTIPESRYLSQIHNFKIMNVSQSGQLLPL